jgi:transcriptional antiterminator RfaH
MSIYIHETEARWFAVRTRSKCEKIVAGILAKKQVIAYVPLVRTIRRYERKVKKVEKPLITCYVFVHITRADYVRVLETENVAGFVTFDKKVQSIPDEEMNLLRRIVLENDIELEAIPGGLVAGDSVIITAGPLTGLSGQVVMSDGRRRFQVELERLGFSLLMTIDAAFLQKTSGALLL